MLSRTQGEFVVLYGSHSPGMDIRGGGSRLRHTWKKVVGSTILLSRWKRPEPEDTAEVLRRRRGHGNHGDDPGLSGQELQRTIGFFALGASQISTAQRTFDRQMTHATTCRGAT